MSRTGYITIFSDQAATFNHPDDYTVTSIIEAYKFEEVPDWVSKSRMFELLTKSKKIKVVEGKKSVAEIDNANGKVKNTEVSAALDAIESETDLTSDEALEEDKDNTLDYTHMKSKELYEICVEKGIEVEAKQPKEYYIDKLS